MPGRCPAMGRGPQSMKIHAFGRKTQWPETDAGIDIYPISILQLWTHHEYVTSLAGCGSELIS